MKYAHIFRRDGVNHVYLTRRKSVRRNGTFYTVCAKRVDKTFQRRVGNGVHAIVTCDPCLTFMVALHDMWEEDDEKKALSDDGGIR